MSTMGAGQVVLVKNDMLVGKNISKGPGAETPCDQRDGHSLELFLPSNGIFKQNKTVTLKETTRNGFKD